VCHLPPILSLRQVGSPRRSSDYGSRASGARSSGTSLASVSTEAGTLLSTGRLSPLGYAEPLARAFCAAPFSTRIACEDDADELLGIEPFVETEPPHATHCAPRGAQWQCPSWQSLEQQSVLFVHAPPGLAQVGSGRRHAPNVPRGDSNASHDSPVRHSELSQHIFAHEPRIQRRPTLHAPVSPSTHFAPRLPFFPTATQAMTMSVAVDEYSHTAPASQPAPLTALQGCAAGFQHDGASTCGHWEAAPSCASFCAPPSETGVGSTTVVVHAAEVTAIPKEAQRVRAMGRIMILR